jgi:hypothetical protein
MADMQSGLSDVKDNALKEEGFLRRSRMRGFGRDPISGTFVIEGFGMA